MLVGKFKFQFSCLSIFLIGLFDGASQGDVSSNGWFMEALLFATFKISFIFNFLSNHWLGTIQKQFSC